MLCALSFFSFFILELTSPHIISQLLSFESSLASPPLSFLFYLSVHVLFLPLLPLNASPSFLLIFLTIHAFFSLSLFFPGFSNFPQFHLLLSLNLSCTLLCSKHCSFFRGRTEAFASFNFPPLTIA